MEYSIKPKSLGERKNNPLPSKEDNWIISELYDLSLDELLKGDATLLNKIERDMKVAKAENNVIKFTWISIVIGVVMIILGNVFDDNPLIDFISAALPWVLLGLMVLFAILYLNKENDN